LIVRDELSMDETPSTSSLGSSGSSASICGARRCRGNNTTLTAKVLSSAMPY